MMHMLRKQRYLMILLTALALVFSLAAHPVLAAGEYDDAARETAAEAAAETPEEIGEEPASESAPAAGPEEPAETEPVSVTGIPEEETPEEAVLPEEDTAPAAPEDTEEKSTVTETESPATPESGEAVVSSDAPASPAEPEDELKDPPDAADPDGTDDVPAVTEEPDAASDEKREIPAEEKKLEEQSASGGEEAPATAEAGEGAGAFADGTYEPSFSFEGGTGKVTITCPKLVIRSGKATATLVFSSSKYTYVLAGGTKYYNENPNGNSTFSVPVNVNVPTEISAETTAMSEAHLVDYTLHVGLAEGAEPEEPATPEEPEEPAFADGTYVPDFTYEGGTGKVTITCPKLVIRSGKATATLVFSSSKYTYALVDGVRYDNENPGGESTFTIPVNVNAPTEISAETTAMSEAHLVDYTLHVGLAEGAEPEEPATPEEPEEPAFADGTYVPDFTYEGGTGKATITCPKLVMKDGKGTATIVFSSTKYTYVLVDGVRYDNENPGGESTFTIPVNVNAPTEISAETTAMSEAHLVDYTLHVGLAEGAEPEEPPAPEEPEEPEPPTDPDEPGTPDDPAGPEDPENPGGQTEPEEPMISENGVLADGVYRAEVETGQPMFKVVDCVITSENGKMTAVITLSGTGYDYLYAGSAKDAYAADGEGWIPFVQDPETGKYTYTLELATVTEPAEVAARSARYASEGRGEAAWIVRTLTIVTDSIVKTANLPEKGQQSDSAGPSGEQGNEPSGGQSGGSGNAGGKDPEPEEPENTGTQDEEEIRKMEENTKKGTVADGTYVPSFGFTGGTGKVTISCPKLVVRNGKGTATLVFSSSKYTYVLVNGTKYYNENPGGKGTFTIPVNVNTTTLVSAETTAMSEAHLIDYVLYIYVDGQDVSNIRPSAAGSSDDAENAEDADQAGTEEEEEEFGPDGRKKNSGWGEYDSIQTKDEPAPAEEMGVPAAGADGTVPETEQEEQTRKKGFSVWYGVGIGAAVIALAGGGFAAMRKGKKRK